MRSNAWSVMRSVSNASVVWCKCLNPVLLGLFNSIGFKKWILKQASSRLDTPQWQWACADGLICVWWRATKDFWAVPVQTSQMNLKNLYFKRAETATSHPYGSCTTKSTLGSFDWHNPLWLLHEPHHYLVCFQWSSTCKWTCLVQWVNLRSYP